MELRSAAHNVHDSSLKVVWDVGPAARTMELNKRDDVDEEPAALAALVAGAIPGLSAVAKECTETMLPCTASNNPIHTPIMPRLRFLKCSPHVTAVAAVGHWQRCGCQLLAGPQATRLEHHGFTHSTYYPGICVQMFTRDHA